MKAQTLVEAETPGPIDSLLATPAGDSRIDLVWSTTEPASTSYEIEWSADGETDWQAVDPPDDGEDTIHSHTGLEAETRYFYRVRGVNEHGEGEWALASATTAPSLPEAPTNLTAEEASTDTIDLSWTAPSGTVTGYEVEWSADGETDWTAVDPEHSGTGTTYSHTGLSANTTYHYRVAAVNDAGTSSWSATASATTESTTRGTREPPAAPKKVSATASGSSRIDVSWTAPDGTVTGYEVEWSADGNGGWQGVDPAHSGTATEYSDTGLAAGTTRSYRVRAVNDAVSGDWSNVASATTERPELTAAFEQVPVEHEGPDTTFTLRLTFSEPVSASYRTLRDEAITATNGAVRKSQRVNGSNAAWNVPV
ncbi:MAG: fibronectin type III domain-containing protein, partial [Acidobacteria bacterium]|nr:fibronectin type III domain-containing protein [Acidobacteriota bacterium]